MALRGLGVLNYYDDAVSGEQYFIKKILPKWITRPAPVLFDVGANVGDYSAMLVTSFPLAKVYSFEPHPITFPALYRSRQENHMFCYNKALGSSIGKLPLFDTANSDGSQHATLTEAVIGEIHHQQLVSHVVEVDTLDNFAAEHNIEYIDFIKIDTEGSELAVLKGGSDLLARKRIGVIQFEFNEMNVYSRSFLNDFRLLLSNYKLMRLLPYGLLELPDTPVLTELYGYQNLVAVPFGSENLI
jgi:FkbM family methyltransferase